MFNLKKAKFEIDNNINPEEIIEDFIEKNIFNFDNIGKQHQSISEFDETYCDDLWARFLESLKSGKSYYLRPLEEQLRGTINNLKSKVLKDCLSTSTFTDEFIASRFKYYLECKEKNEDIDKTSTLVLWSAFVVTYFLVAPLLFDGLSNQNKNKSTDMSIQIPQKAQIAIPFLVPLGSYFITSASNRRIKRLRYFKYLFDISEIKIKHSSLENQ